MGIVGLYVINNGGKPGEVLIMADGTKWFHPYSGARPIRLSI